MLNGIISKVVSNLLGRYIEKIDSSQLEVDLWNGKARLENLKVSSNALSSHNLPFTVESGTIGCASFVFPWGQLDSQPCIINVENVFILASISSNVITTNDLSCSSNNENESGLMSSVFDKIIDNIQINIQNLHVRVDLPIGDDSIVSVGFMIESLNVYSVNELLNECFITPLSNVVRKKANISNLSFYIDTLSKKIEGNFENEMLNSFHLDHQYLLKPFTFDCVYISKRRVGNQLLINTSSLELVINSLQWKGLLILEEQYRQFSRRRQFSHCGRPDRYPRSSRSSGLWWRFIHRCTIAKKNPQSIEIINAIDILKNRKRYVTLYQNGTKDEIKAFEKRFELSTVIFLRNYAKTFLRHQDNSNGSGFKLTKEELDLLFKNKSSQEALPFATKINIDKLFISMLDESLKSLTKLELNQILINFKKILYDLSFNIKTSNTILHNEISKTFPVIFSCKETISLTSTIKSNCDSKHKLNIAPMTAIIEMEWIKMFIKFFSKGNKTNIDIKDEDISSILKIIAAISKYYRRNIDIVFNKPKIIFPYQEISIAPLFILELSLFEVSSTPNLNLNSNDYSTLYDLYTFKLLNAKLSLNDSDLIMPFDGSFNIKYGILNIPDIFPYILAYGNFSKTMIFVSLYEYILLQEFIFYLSDEMSTMYSPGSSEQNKISNPNRFNFVFSSLQLNISYKDKKIFDFISDSFECSIVSEYYSKIILTAKNLVGNDYLYSKSQFLNTKNVKYQYQNNCNSIFISNSEIYGYQKIVFLLYEFFNDFDTFEQKLGHEKTYNYSDIKHKNMSQCSDYNELLLEIKIEKSNLHLCTNEEFSVVQIVDSFYYSYNSKDDFLKHTLNFNKIKLSNHDNFINIDHDLSIIYDNNSLSVKENNNLNFDLSGEFIQNLKSYFYGLQYHDENKQVQTNYITRSFVVDLNIEELYGKFDKIGLKLNHIIINTTKSIEVTEIEIENFCLNYDEKDEIISLNDLNMNTELTLFEDKQNDNQLLIKDLIKSIFFKVKIKSILFTYDNDLLTQIYCKFNKNKNSLNSSQRIDIFFDFDIVMAKSNIIFNMKGIQH